MCVIHRLSNKGIASYLLSKNISLCSIFHMYLCRYVYIHLHVCTYTKLMAHSQPLGHVCLHPGPCWRLLLMRVSVTVGVGTPWKSTSLARQGVFPESRLVSIYFYSLCMYKYKIFWGIHKRLLMPGSPRNGQEETGKTVVGLESYLLYFRTSKCVTYFETSVQSNQKVPADSQFHLSVLFMMPSSCQGKERNSLRGKGTSGFIT